MDLQQAYLPGLIGMRYTEASKDRLVAELTIRDDLRTVGGALHGGTIMALADTVGATATFLNLPPGASTTTLESKTNFFAAGRDGVVRAEATPLHRGRTTMVWQTRVTDASGRRLAGRPRCRAIARQPAPRRRAPGGDRRGRAEPRPSPGADFRHPPAGGPAVQHAAPDRSLQLPERHRRRGQRVEDLAGRAHLH